MKIETKFNIGDKVYLVSDSTIGITINKYKIEDIRIKFNVVTKENYTEYYIRGEKPSDSATVNEDKLYGSNELDNALLYIKNQLKKENKE